MITPTEEGTLPYFLNKYLQGRTKDLKLEGGPVLGRGLWAFRPPVGLLGQSPSGGPGSKAPGSSWILENFLGKNEAYRLLIYVKFLS